MLGYALLAIGLILYLLELRKWSLFIFASFMLKGWCVFTDDILEVKNYDLAFIFVFVVLAFTVFSSKKTKDLKDRSLQYWLLAFLVFMFFNISFSFNHYHFTGFQILQGSRASFLFLSYFFLRRQKTEDLLWLNRIFFYITLITSVLYIIEVFLNLPVLPYKQSNVKIDEYTGIMRYYNSPPLLYWYLFVSVLAPNLLKSRLTFISVFIFIIALFATLGRTQIGMTSVVLLIALIMQGRMKSILSAVFAGMLLIAPFSGIIGNRFAGKFNDSTESEIKSVLNGGIQETVQLGNAKDVGTFTYRMAWVYERAEYLSERPIGENIFGLGLISDSQVLTVEQLYNFNIGLMDEEGNMPQLSTGDISYGNILTKYGYFGGTLFLCIWIYLLYYFIKWRKVSDYSFLGVALIINMILLSLSGTSISDQGNLIFPYIIFLLLNKSIFDYKLHHPNNSISEGDTNGNESTAPVPAPVPSVDPAPPAKV